MEDSEEYAADTFNALGLAVIAAPQKDESGASRPHLRKQPGEIKIGSDDYTLLGSGGRKDEFVSRAAHRQFTRMNCVVTK